MIAVFADNHFGARPGFHLHQKLNYPEEAVFHEDTFDPLPELLDRPDCRLLMLNWISDTSGNAHPGPEVEEPLKRYLESGRPLLLVHGASAAFHRWDWWRALVGLRWVRGEDPDGFPASTHPVRPFRVEVARTRHPLARRLQPFDLPADEIYINLEQTASLWTLLETTTEEGTFPQAWVTRSPWGGAIAGFLPGHKPEAFAVPELVANVETLMAYLLEMPF